MSFKAVNCLFWFHPNTSLNSVPELVFQLASVLIIFLRQSDHMESNLSQHNSPWKSSSTPSKLFIIFVIFYFWQSKATSQHKTDQEKWILWLMDWFNLISKHNPKSWLLRFCLDKAKHFSMINVAPQTAS